MSSRKVRRQHTESTLNTRGLSLRAHYRHEFPKWIKELQAKGEEEAFFLNLQKEYEETAARVVKENLPPGGAQKILSEMYYPVDETPGRLDRPIMY